MMKSNVGRALMVASIIGAVAALDQRPSSAPGKKLTPIVDPPRPKPRPKPVQKEEQSIHSRECVRRRKQMAKLKAKL